MDNAVLARYFMNYGIFLIGLPFCGFFFFKKVKLAHWQFFYGKQKEWAKKHEEILNKVCRWAFLVIFLLDIVVLIPYVLDTSYVITHNYKRAEGIATMVASQNIQISNEKVNYHVNVSGLREGDYVELIYLPFTKLTTITKVYEIEWRH